jgi:hypothetical protein
LAATWSKRYARKILTTGNLDNDLKRMNYRQTRQAVGKNIPAVKKLTDA